MTTAVEIVSDQMQKGQKRDFYVTRLTLNGNNYYSCNFCKRECRTRVDCIRHTRIHTGEKPFSCFYCKKPFSLKHDAKVHERIHTGEKPFSCRVCGLAFSCASKLIAHRKLKKNIACGLTSGSKGKQSNWRQITAFNSKPDEQVCQITTDNNTKVKRVKVQTGERPYACKYSYCDKSFSYNSLCRNHERTHLGVNVLHCNACNKGYRSKSGLNSHLKRSNGSKCVNYILEKRASPVLGPTVDEATSSVVNRKIQRDQSMCKLNSSTTPNVISQKVDGKVLYFCRFCKKTFPSNSKYERHIRSHTGLKPFNCSFCKKTFSSGENVKIHERIHTGSKPYICVGCGSGFVTSGGRASHLKSKKNLACNIMFKQTDSSQSEGHVREKAQVFSYE